MKTSISFQNYDIYFCKSFPVCIFTHLIVDYYLLKEKGEEESVFDDKKGKGNARV